MYRQENRYRSRENNIKYFFLLRYLKQKFRAIHIAKLTNGMVRLAPISMQARAKI